MPYNALPIKLDLCPFVQMNSNSTNLTTTAILASINLASHLYLLL